MIAIQSHNEYMAALRTLENYRSRLHLKLLSESDVKEYNELAYRVDLYELHPTKPNIINQH